MPYPLRRFYPGSSTLPSLGILLCLFLLTSCVRAEPWSLERGELPLVIVAAHGGVEELLNAEPRDPDRVDDPKFVIYGDAQTIELASLLSCAIRDREPNGHAPSVLLNHAHRKYADLNRPAERASHDPDGQEYHRVFHGILAEELRRLVQEHGWALLIDIHGQAHYPTTLMIGTANNTIISDWSVKRLWGDGGIVEQLVRAGFSVTPETSTGQQHYGGGYLVRQHGASDKVEAWQFEHSRELRLDPDLGRTYVNTLADALVSALRTHVATPTTTP